MHVFLGGDAPFAKGKPLSQWLPGHRPASDRAWYSYREDVMLEGHPESLADETDVARGEVRHLGMERRDLRKGRPARLNMLSEPRALV